MGLFDTSATTATNAQNNTISSVQLARAAGAVENVANEARSVVTGTIAAGEQLVASTVGAVVKTAENVVSEAVSGVATLFSSAEHAVASAVTSTVSSIFGNTSNTALSQVATIIPDPIASSFAGGTPQSTLFSTSPINAQVGQISFAGQSSSSTYALPASIEGSLSTLSSRYGQSTSYLSAPGNLNSTVSGDLKTSYLSGAFTSLGTGIATGIQTVATVGAVVNTVSNDYQSLVNGISRDLTGSTTGLNGFYNPLLPTTATANGTPIAGIPPQTSSSTLDSLTSAVSALGCGVNSTVGYTPYGATQSLYGSLLALASQLNINTLLDDLLGCSQYGAYGQSVATNMFYSSAGSNAGTALTLSNYIPASGISVTRPLTTSIVTNPNLSPSDTSSVLGILTNLKVQPASVLTTGTQIGDDNVWDSSVVSMTPSYLSSNLSGQNLAVLQNGSSVNLDQSDFGVVT